jgi:hypothetical protein
LLMKKIFVKFVWLVSSHRLSIQIKYLGFFYFIQ